MKSIVGVRFQRAGHVHYFDAGGLDLEVNEYVVAELNGMDEVGRVVISPDQVLINQLRSPVVPLLRKATEEDLRLSDEKRPRP